MTLRANSRQAVAGFKLQHVLFELCYLVLAGLQLVAQLLNVCSDLRLCCCNRSHILLFLFINYSHKQANNRLQFNTYINSGVMAEEGQRGN